MLRVHVYCHSSTQAFVDLALKKLDRTRFDPPIDPHESSNLRGSFAKVVKRNFDTRVSSYKWYWAKTHL